MPKSPEAPITASLFRWARETAGYSRAEAAKKIDCTEKEVASWEDGGALPRLAQLRAAASMFRRPVSVFFLESRPEEELPKDFRTIGDAKPLGLSPKARFALRHAESIQELAKDFLDLLDEPVKKARPNIKATMTPSAAAEAIEQWLGSSMEARLEIPPGDGYQAFDYWVALLESQRVAVSQLSIATAELRGACLYDDVLPVLVVSTKDAINGRIFSLFHELTHLLMKQSAMSIAASDDVINDDDQELSSVELFCNAVAGGFLVPKAPLVQFLQDDQRDINTGAPIVSVARKLNVSRLVVLRRAFELQMIGKSNYFELLKTWSGAGGGDGGMATQAQQCLKRSSRLMTKMILSAVSARRITLREALGAFNIRAKHIPELLKMV